MSVFTVKLLRKFLQVSKNPSSTIDNWTVVVFYFAWSAEIGGHLLYKFYDFIDPFWRGFLSRFLRTISMAPGSGRLLAERRLVFSEEELLEESLNIRIFWGVSAVHLARNYASAMFSSSQNCRLSKKFSYKNGFGQASLESTMEAKIPSRISRAAGGQMENGLLRKFGNNFADILAYSARGAWKNFPKIGHFAPKCRTT